MEVKKCSYHASFGGEISNVTTSCSIERRGGFSKVTFSNDSINYSFLIGKATVTISAFSQTEYSFTLAENKRNNFSITLGGAVLNAQVWCKSLKIENNNGNLLVKASYQTEIGDTVTPIDFSLTVL
ncbi:MAG: hypothetical protein IKL82_01990 [Clostridia bacterium]|nr:hypothetical protein [Clostridia bacterium]